MKRVIFHVDVNSAFLSWEACYRMAISSITERFYLDEKGCDRFIEIMEKTENRPVKQIQMTNKYEEGKKLLKKFFCQ